MAKTYTLTTANLKVLQVHAGAGISCGRGETALNDLGARAKATGDVQFAQETDSLLTTMRQKMIEADTALAAYRKAVYDLRNLHEAKSGK